jgi:4a-hydroxytetrahydrobiopterin dehydratase
MLKIVSFTFSGILLCCILASTTSAASPERGVAQNQVMQRLSESAIAERIQRLPGWAIDGANLSCTYQFGNFVEAIAFVNRLVEPAEALQHHPTLTIAYNRVSINLTTHDAGGLTDLDFDLAETMTRLANPDIPLGCQP